MTAPQPPRMENGETTLSTVLHESPTQDGEALCFHSNWLVVTHTRSTGHLHVLLMWKLDSPDRLHMMC